MMSQLSRDNLQEFCRVCLQHLQSAAFNVSLVPDFAELLLLLTSSMDMGMDMRGLVADIPERLCQMCYHKVSDIDAFRKLATQSASLLYRIISEPGCGRPAGAGVPVKLDTANDDDQLLLPELAPLWEKSIKTEPLDIDDTHTHIQHLQGISDKRSDDGDGSDHDDNDNNNDVDDDDDGGRGGDNDDDDDGDGDVDVDGVTLNGRPLKSEYDAALFEEDSSANCYLGSTYDSIGDDADDEEQALRNGAANTSSVALKKPTSSGTLAHKEAPPRKRDRKKKSLQCPQCEKQVYKQVYLDAHVRAVHEGQKKPFVCAQCAKAFTRYNQLQVHSSGKHQSSQKYVCGYRGCPASFKMRNTLETHRKVAHSNDVPFSLELQETLELHQEQLTKEIEMEHTCRHCFKNYSSKSALSDHLKRHAQIKKHVCQECGTAKVTRSELQTHMRTHEKNPERYRCTICPQEFNHKNAITRHVRVVHEGQRRFPCGFCPKRFGTRNSQVCHERLHTGDRPYNCEVCYKGFAQLDGFKTHMNNHKKNQRKHVCSYCSRRFITRKNLDDHEKRHRSEKPHICNLCCRGFYHQEDLVLHKQLHAADKGQDYSEVEKVFVREGVVQEDGSQDRHDSNDNSDGNSTTTSQSQSTIATRHSVLLAYLNSHKNS